MRTYTEHFTSRLPRFIRGRWGKLFGAVVGGLIQRAKRAAEEAVLARYIETAPDDALPYAAADTRLPRFLEGDTLGELRERLRDPWGFWADVGQLAGLRDALEILGFDPLLTWPLDASSGALWMHADGWWSTWSVVTKNPTWSQRSETWNALEARGLTWAQWQALGEAWDYDTSASTFSQLAEFLWSYKWPYGVPVYVVIVFGDGYVWDELTARGWSWSDVEGDGLIWDEMDDADVLVVQTARLWGALTLEDGNAPITWDQIEALGPRWSRCMTAR